MDRGVWGSIVLRAVKSHTCFLICLMFQYKYCFKVQDLDPETSCLSPMSATSKLLLPLTKSIYLFAFVSQPERTLMDTHANTHTHIPFMTVAR